MFAIALIVGIGMAALCSVAIGSNRGKWAVGGLVGMLVLTFLCAPVVASPFLFVQALLLLVVLGVGRWISLRPKYLIGACWTASMVAFALAIFVGQSQVWHLRELRDKYPFVLVRHRLQYESKRTQAESDAHANLATSRVTPAPIVLAAEVERQMREDGAHQRSDYRRYMLERLHDARYEAFIASSGFGVGRMIGVSDEGLKLDEQRMPPGQHLPKRPLLADGLQSEEWQPLEVGTELNPGSDFPQFSPLKSMANDARQEFLNADRFGFVRDNQVSGFVSHRMIYLPSLSASETADERWKLTRLELVSLLKFSEPAVYLSDELPNMERLASVPTRPLNSFEREALAKLRTEEDLVVRYSANTIRMLGSLRAGKTCLECHSVQRGDLLGAFSYELRRMPPISAPAKTPAKLGPEA